jgi:1-acyl-sn-glycerol-3-phosphate acyltransferase
VGDPPGPPKYVLIAAPHTSNWDFIFLLAFAWYYGVEISWLGKREMFRWPFGGFFERLGGIPVARASSGNMVDRMKDQFDAHERLCLVVPVEGTRSYVDYWKSGFYHIARAAGVPIVMSYLDYPRKLGGFGAALMPTGDIPVDMDAIRAFYDGKQGKHVEWTGRIRLKEEDQPAEATA